MGEILLVVIGILIALQVNNWNQQRIENNMEENYLLLLKEELQANIDFIQSFYLDRYDDKMEALETVRQYYRGNYQIQDSLEFANQITYGAIFGSQAIGTESIVFEEIINTGNLKVIRNEELRQGLMKYYGDLEAIRLNLTFYNSGYLSETNTFRPFDGANPNYIDAFDAAMSIRHAGTEEFYKITNAEMTYAGIARYFMTLLRDSALELIDQIETDLEKF